MLILINNINVNEDVIAHMCRFYKVKETFQRNCLMPYSTLPGKFSNT